MSVIDRAANWVHSKPRKNRRVPPHGIPQQSVESILSNPLDSFDDEVFNIGIGDQIELLPKGSFLEVRRSVPVEPVLFLSVLNSVQEPCDTSRSRNAPILLW